MADSQPRLPGFDDADDAAALPALAAAPPLEDDGPVSIKNRTVYVIDAHALIYQVFHAMPPMTSPSGQPCGAVHGFVRDILDLIENRKPDFLFCAFDYSGQTFRHEFYPEYKGTREEMPDDLRPQIDSIRRILTAMQVPVIDLENYEADDIIATFARLIDEQQGRGFIVSSDKDCRQLISDHVKIYNIRKNRIYDENDLMKDWGVRPDQVVSFQSLVGDSVDNVPGIALIGPKIARELLEKYNTLDGVLDNASSLSGVKRRENLMNGREAADLSRRLVTLDRHTPVEIDWRQGITGISASEEVFEMCKEFGFRRLADRIKSLAVKTGSPDISSTTAESKDWKATYTTIGTLEELQKLVAEMLQQKLIVLDTETTSTNPRFAEIVGYSFSWKYGEAYYVPVLAPRGDPQIDPQAALEALRPVLENEAIEKAGQNLKYELIVLQSAGVELRGALFDTMLADYLLDPGERNHSLDDLAARYLNHRTIKIKELIGAGKKQKLMSQVPVALVTPYAAEDADVPFRMAATLKQHLEDSELTGLYTSLEAPLVRVLARMEYTGIKVNIKRLQELSVKHGDRIVAAEKEIYELAGRKFNINSPKQLGKVLFEELNLPVIKKAASGPSTAVDVLTVLAREHELPAKVLGYRQNMKLKTTYIDALPELVHPETGRVHTSFTQTVAATGRLSSTEPNLQNIPVRTAEGREIRSAFIPGESGWSLLAADYSQIELRILAHFCGDGTLIDAFQQGHDIHAMVASEVYGAPLADVTSDQRRRAKAINFGIIYGQSSYGLAAALGIEKEEAAEFIDTYFSRYPGVEQFIEKVLGEARSKGYVTTILGRRRTIQGVRSRNRANPRNRNTPERIAVNTVIQGSAADLIKQAMIALHDRLPADGFQARMLLQIHDELVFEAPQNELSSLREVVEEEMTGAQQIVQAATLEQYGAGGNWSESGLRVPLVVDAKVGPDWASCEPVDA